MDRNECYARLGQACFILNVRRHNCGNKFDGTIVICLIRHSRITSRELYQVNKGGVFHKTKLNMRYCVQSLPK